MLVIMLFQEPKMKPPSTRGEMVKLLYCYIVKWLDGF